MLAGRQLVAPIMFTGNHVNYQPLIVNDMRIRLEAPPLLSEYIESGDHLRGVGGDYVAEVENKHLKPFTRGSHNKPFENSKQKSSYTEKKSRSDIRTIRCERCRPTRKLLSISQKQFKHFDW